MRSIDVIEIEDLKIPGSEFMESISAAFSNHRKKGEQRFFHGSVLVWEGEDQRRGVQKGNPYLIRLEFSSAELYRRFGLMSTWEQRILVRAMLGKLNDPETEKMEFRPTFTKSVEMGIPWSPTTRRRVSAELSGIEAVGNGNTEPRIGLAIRIGLV